MHSDISCEVTTRLQGGIQGATVKARTQERGTEHGTKVMWLHTGNYNTINGSFPAATSCSNTAIFHRPCSLSLKNIQTDLETSFHQSRYIISLSLRLTSQSKTHSFSRCKRVCLTSRDYSTLLRTCTKSVRQAYLYLGERDLSSSLPFFAWMKSPSVTIRQLDQQLHTWPFFNVLN